MNTQEIFIAHPKTEAQVHALRAFMQALHIDFEVADRKEYNPEFVAKVLESRQQAREGKTRRVEKEDLKEFLGL